ncbi:MAG: Hsp70 family protein [Thiomargarita sp.]|nr:Hsp70 family protein [Thiomargarita sp.]
MALLPFFGIDLGTTNTVIAAARKDRHHLIDSTIVKIFQQDKHGDKSYMEYLPSVLFFKQDGNIIVGDYAKSMIALQPNKVLYNSKRFMGRNEEWSINSRTMTASTVAAEILKTCKNEILRKFSLNSVKDIPIIITHPASFNIDQSRDTENAAVLAGFSRENVTLLDEPVAALIEYVNSQTNMAEEFRAFDFWTKKRVLVYDLGGGTCDVCIVDIQLTGKESISFIEIGTGRYSEFGGSDFDKCWATSLLNAYLQEHGITKDKITQEEIILMENKLILHCEEVKEFFSGEWEMYNDESKIPEMQKNIESFYANKWASFVLTKDMFDKATESLYTAPKKKNRDNRNKLADKNIETPINNTIQKYNINVDEIDFVYLTGGMSKYKKIQEKIKDMLGKKVVISDDPMASIAKGASIYGHFVVSHQKTENTPIETTTDDEIFQAELNPILAESIMVDVAEGLPIEIIPKDQTLPYTGKTENIFKTASPNGIKIYIYAGEDVYDSEMRIQRAYSKQFDLPVSVGAAMNIEYTIDTNKNLQLKAIIKDGTYDSQEISLYCESIDILTTEPE